MVHVQVARTGKAANISSHSFCCEEESSFRSASEASVLRKRATAVATVAVLQQAKPKPQTRCPAMNDGKQNQSQNIACDG